MAAFRDSDHRRSARSPSLSQSIGRSEVGIFKNRFNFQSPSSASWARLIKSAYSAESVIHSSPSQSVRLRRVGSADTVSAEEKNSLLASLSQRGQVIGSDIREWYTIYHFYANKREHEKNDCDFSERRIIPSCSPSTKSAKHTRK